MQVSNIHHRKRTHKKRALRFTVFFLFLILYSIIEDLTAFYLHGVEFDMAIIAIVVVIATCFTAIAEISEFVFKKEEPKIEKFVKKEGHVIKKEEKKIQSGIKKDGKIIRNKIKVSVI